MRLNLTSKVNPDETVEFDAEPLPGNAGLAVHACPPWASGGLPYWQFTHVESGLRVGGFYEDRESALIAARLATGATGPLDWRGLDPAKAEVAQDGAFVVWNRVAREWGIL